MTVTDRYRELFESFRWNVPAQFNITQWTCTRWASDSGRVAVLWEDESGARASWTYAQVQEAANRLSNALAALGIARGDRVAMMLPQRPEAAVTYLPIFQMGAVAVPLSFLFGRVGTLLSWRSAFVIAGMLGCTANGRPSGHVASSRAAASRITPSYVRIRSPWNGGSITLRRDRCSWPSSSSSDRAPTSGLSVSVRPGGSPCRRSL